MKKHNIKKNIVDPTKINIVRNKSIFKLFTVYDETITREETI